MSENPPKISKLLSEAYDAVVEGDGLEVFVTRCLICARDTPHLHVRGFPEQVCMPCAQRRAANTDSPEYKARMRRLEENECDALHCIREKDRIDRKRLS